MSWAIEGVEATIGLRNGATYVAGTAKQVPHLVTDASADLISKIREAEALWSIHPNTAPKSEIDELNPGFYERVRAAPNDTHFSILFHPAENDQRMAIGFDVCLPDRTFEEWLPVWRDFVFRSSAARYTLILDYLGFRTPGAKTNNVTPEEWTEGNMSARKLAIGSGVTFAFHSRTS